MIIEDCKHCENYVTDAYGDKVCAFDGDCENYVLTNEEWLKQANTEQLAEWIASVVQKAISIKENNDIVMLESAIWWDEWLKQPHTPKE